MSSVYLQILLSVATQQAIGKNIYEMTEIVNKLIMVMEMMDGTDGSNDTVEKGLHEICSYLTLKSSQFVLMHGVLTGAEISNIT